MDLQDRIPVHPGADRQRRPEGGFAAYHYEKAGEGVQPKLSYVRLIPGTDIMVRAGVYTDSVEAERIELAPKYGYPGARNFAYLIGIFLLILGATATLTLLLSHAGTGRSRARLGRYGSHVHGHIRYQ